MSYNSNFYHIFYYVSVFGMLLFIGYTASYLKDQNHNPKFYGKYLHNSEGIKFRVESIIKKAPEYYTVKANVKYILFDKKWINAEGSLLCYLNADSSVKSGYQIVSNAIPSRFREPINPGEFNIKKYYSNKGIPYFLYLEKDDYSILESEDIDWSSYLDRFRWRLRDQLVKSLQYREAGVAIAMILGLKNDLTEELKGTYAKIGIMHILAVSGLHIGVLFLVIRFLFGGFRYHRLWKWIFMIVSLSLIWSYAFLAGLSSSVFRAAIMFSAFIVGEMLNRKNYLLNSTAFAAFLILIINPNAIYDVGFQLSFSAVTAIIILYDPLFHIFSFQNNFVKSTWQLLCVSIAAQVGTLPISLYYFHQFSPGFLVANLFAVPLAFAMLSCGFLYVLFFITIGVNALVATLLQILIYLSNTIFIVLEHLLPVVEHISINLWQVVLSYIFILSIYAFFANKKLSRYALVAVTMSLLLIVTTWIKVGVRHQHKIIFYSTPEGAVLDQINGSHYREVVLKQISEASYQYNITPVRNYFSANTEWSNERVVQENKKYVLTVLNGKSILSVKDQNMRLPGNLDVDFLVLAKGKFAKFWYNYYKNVARNIVIGPDVNVTGSYDKMPDVFNLENKCLIINGLRREAVLSKN